LVTRRMGERQLILTCAGEAFNAELPWPSPSDEPFAMRFRL
jgi:hypothetical protein